jgi:hypothetical protein
VTLGFDSGQAWREKTDAMIRHIYPAALLVLCLCGTRAIAQTTISLPLSTSASGKIDLGPFAGGTMLQISVTGSGDLANSNYQTNPDGSLAAVAGSPWTYANPGAAIGTIGGQGDGTNHFVGGGGNYDFGGGSGYGFAGLETTDTTNPQTIRAGAVVGTFASSPSRADWFILGYGGTFTVPGGGADFFVAVNDSFSSDNHGNYSLTFTAVPEPATAALWIAMIGGGFVIARRCRRNAATRSFTPLA